MNDMVVDAVDHLVRGIVSDPDAVTVRASGGRRGTVIRVAVAPDDLGRVIGRGGRTASAIRSRSGSRPSSAASRGSSRSFPAERSEAVTTRR